MAISINKNIVALGRDGKWKDILSLYEDQKEHFCPVNYATVMSQLGRIRHMRKDDPLLKKFLADLSTKLHENGIKKWLPETRHVANIVHAIGKFRLPPNCNSSAMEIMRLVQEQETVEWIFEDGTTPQVIANCLWAYATLGIEAPNLFRVLDERAEWLFQHGNQHDVAISAWSCGKLGVKSPNLFRLLDQHATWVFENGTPQNIANCVWACGTLGIESPNLFRLLDERADWLFQHGNQQDIANSMWACGTLRMDSPNLFRLLNNRAQWLFENGTPQNIANCAWACGVLGIKLPNLFGLLNERAEWLVDHGNQQDVASSVWACGTLGIESPNLFRLLDERADWLFENRNQQNIANCVWSCGKLGVEALHVFRLLNYNAERMFVDGTPQGIANSIWACGKLGIEPPNMLRLLNEHAHVIIETGNSQHVANVASALASLGSQSPAFFSALERGLNTFLIQSDHQHLCNVGHAIVVLGINTSKQRDMLATIWNSLLERQIDALPSDELSQILYIQNSASAFGIDLARPPPDLQRQLANVSFTFNTSNFEENVSKALSGMGFSHRRDVSPFEAIPGLLPIDIACPDRMIAIECDGPYHYVSILGDEEEIRRVEDGPTRAKRRLLQQLGWNVINLNLVEGRQHGISEEWIKSKLT